MTLSWTYSLGGTFISATFGFVNATSGFTVGIAQKFRSGSTDVSQGFKERFLASITDSEAHFTILSVQRSDKGTYQFQAGATNFGSLSDAVDVEVHCKFISLVHCRKLFLTLCLDYLRGAQKYKV